MARAARLLIALCIGVASAATMHAAVPLPPDQVAYSGYVAGAPPSPQLIVARIYDDASGGTLVYRQVFGNVAVTDGHFTVHLGPIGSSLAPRPRSPRACGRR